jgi:hypothetical protein
MRFALILIFLKRLLRGIHGKGMERTLTDES